MRVNRLSGSYRHLGVTEGLRKQLHPDGSNLFLQAQRAADGGIARSWLLRYVLRGAGKTREMGLGSIADLSLAQAREEAARWRRLAKEGHDPIEMRAAERLRIIAARRKALTVDQCFRDFVAAREGDWTNAAHRAQWLQTWRDYVSPIIGKLAVASVDTPDALRVLTPIWQSKPETGRRVRARLESVLGFAETAKHRPAGANPARWEDHLENLLPRKNKPAAVHLAALPHPNVAAFMVALRKLPGMAPLALRFLILSAVRWSDVRLAKAADVDRGEKTWTIERLSKTGKRHVVPLSAEALKVFDAARALSGKGDLLFPSERGRPLPPHALRAAIAGMGAGPITVHGFRSSFRDWALEASTFPSELSEMVLGHSVGSAVERAYRRGDALLKRAAIMQAWADYIAEPRGATVTPFRRRRAGK